MIRWCSAPAKKTLFLASPAGRNARTFEVCSSGRTYATLIDSPRSGATPRRFQAHPTDPQSAVSALPGLLSKYQNPFRNPYGLLPRPPQTQAAHFKRLYRK
jgi:hypothetical protein